MASTDYVMTMSRNGQVSIPAAVRARWRADDAIVAGKVVVVDMGDYIVIGPALKDPVGSLRGVLAGRGVPTTDEMRRQDREDDAAYEAKREAQLGPRGASSRTA